MKISIIIPALNEGNSIEPALISLSKLSKHVHEIILVDGGSQDNTVEIAQSYVDITIQSPKGRALQMNAGASMASGDVLWFLHADSLVADNADATICKALQTTACKWGRFNIKLSGSRWVFRIIEQLINIRSRLTKIATGDQGIFVLRESFELLNGYTNIPIMEDIDISKRLNNISSPVCLKDIIITSSRRWESTGIIKTVVLMWYLRFAYFIGVPADRLIRKYSR